MRHIGAFVTTLLTVILGLATAASAQNTTPLTVMTYNTKHGGSCTGCSANAQMDIIKDQTPRPDVVVLQEMPLASVPTYVNGLNSRYGLDAATGFDNKYKEYCNPGSTAPDCTTPDGQGVAILVLKRYPIKSSSWIQVFALDHYASARPVLRAEIEVNGTRMQIFVTHLVPNFNGTSYQNSRKTGVTKLKDFAAGYPELKLIAGDFNAHPNDTEISNVTTGMASDYVDAWTVSGMTKTPSAGLSHPADVPNDRIDYWFADTSGRAVPRAGVVPNAPSQSDHRPVVITYDVDTLNPPPPPPPTGYPSDNFNDNILSSIWTRAIWSGSTQDPNLQAREINSRFEIGPLPATSGHWNGITTGAFDFSNAYAYVKLITPANPATTAYSMFTVGNDSTHYYRFYASGGLLYAQSNINGKVDHQVAYTPSQATFLRIRHDGTNVVFESAPPDSADATKPGAWTNPPLYSEPWNSAVAIGSLKFELKAGTSLAEAAPGTVVFDDFSSGPTNSSSLLSDSFSPATQPAAVDSAKWNNSLISSSAYPTITVQQNNDQLEIGNLPAGVSGSSYDGITSVDSYDFTGGSVSVKIAAGPPNRRADQMMLTLPIDTQNHYRFFIQGNTSTTAGALPTITFQKKTSGVKDDFGSAPIDLSVYKYIRIRHDAVNNLLVFEVSGESGGQPSGWIVPPNLSGSNTVSTTGVALGALFFELKGGTSRSEAASAIQLAFDSFLATKQ